MMRMLRAEWQKVWFPKSTRLFLPLSAILSLLISLFLMFTTQITQGKALSSLAAMSVMEVSILAVDVISILLIFFAAVQIGREFQLKTIQSYIVAYPTRNLYCIAKLLLYAVLSLSLGAVVSVVAFANGQLVLQSLHSQTLITQGAWRLAIGTVSMPVFYTVITVCAAFITKNTAAAIAIPFIVLFLPALLKIAPPAYQQALLPLTPTAAIHTLSGIAKQGDVEYSGALPAILLLAAWFSAFLASALFRFRKADL